MEENNQSTVFCKSCSQPLIIDSSFDNMDENSITNGFLIINDVTPFKNTSPSCYPVDFLTKETTVTNKLFEILNDHSSIDHPLCEECADIVLEKMDQKLKTLEEESKYYSEFLENLDKKMKTSDDGPSLEKLRKKILDLQLEERKSIEELETIEKSRKEYEEKIQLQTNEIKRLLEDEAKIRIEYNHWKHILSQYNEERKNIEIQKSYVEKHLEILTDTNVFNATFHIWYDGHFGTINGFRLGRLSTHPVNWSEINAAWGQTVLLLYALAKKIGFTFKRYKLVPFGNHSFIETLDEKPKELPLYGSGGFRYMLDGKFDQAMIAFLDCMKQIGEELEKVESRWFLPYRMKGEKIEDTQSGYSYSIKMRCNSEEEWTKALKYMLTNLKWILTAVARDK